MHWTIFPIRVLVPVFWGRGLEGQGLTEAWALVTGPNVRPLHLVPPRLLWGGAKEGDLIFGCDACPLAKKKCASSKKKRENKGERKGRAEYEWKQRSSNTCAE